MSQGYHLVAGEAPWALLETGGVQQGFGGVLVAKVAESLSKEATDAVAGEDE